MFNKKIPKIGQTEKEKAQELVDKFKKMHPHEIQIYVATQILNMAKNIYTLDHKINQIKSLVEELHAENNTN